MCDVLSDEEFEKWFTSTLKSIIEKDKEILEALSK